MVTVGHTQNLLPSISLKSSHILLSKCAQKHCEGTSVPRTLPMVWFHSSIHEKVLRKQWSWAWCVESESIARTPLIVLYECILANVSLNTTLSTASNYCHCHCSASSTAFCPLCSLVPKTFTSTGTLTTVQHFWTWRFLHRKTDVQICGRPTPIWKSHHGKQKEDEFSAFPATASLCHYSQSWVISIVFSLLPKLYALPKCFNSFLYCCWERGGEMGIKRHNRKDTDYSALFSVSFVPWILCFVFLYFIIIIIIILAVENLFVPTPRNLSLLLSNTKRKRSFMVFAITFSHQRLNYSHFLHEAWLLPQGPLTLSLMYESSLVGL